MLGQFQWRTFTQTDSEAESFGRGLRELGLKPRENVVVFAETRAEWLISANGCMKQNMPIVTLYATLGDDAIIHGINETEVSCVITSQELLPKFKNILPCTPNVSLLVSVLIMSDHSSTLFDFLKQDYTSKATSKDYTSLSCRVLSECLSA